MGPVSSDPGSGALKNRVLNTVEVDNTRVDVSSILFRNRVKVFLVSQEFSFLIHKVFDYEKS